MLLAEELALVAIHPDRGRHALGTRSELNACLAALFVADLLLDGSAQPGDKADRVVLADGIDEAKLPVELRAVAQVVREKGPKIKAVMSHMDRGLRKALGSGTWDTAVAGLERQGVLGPESSGLVSRTPLLDPAAREAVVTRLRAAAAGDDALDIRTAVLLSMTGPAQLLEVVAPDRASRRHARRRIDHALDDHAMEPLAKAVRALLAEAAAAAGVIAAGVAVSAGAS